MIKKKIALVTGGAGFIGSHLVDLLIKKNFKVRVIDNLSGGRLDNLKHHKKNKNFIFKKLDINKMSLKEKIFKDVSYIFHLAGKGDIVPSIENPLNYMITNVIGTTKVLENCRNQKIKKFVYAASSSCYGLASTPTNEKHKISPEYPYALSKFMGEQACFHWSKVYKIPTISIRIFNAYGPRVKTTGVYGAVFGVFFKQKLENKPLTLVGDGLQRRDFLNVRDVANAFYMSAISKEKNEIYNLGSGKPKKILDLIKLLGTKKIVKLPKRPGEPDCTWADIKKIKKQINWKPSISFKYGVNEMLSNIDSWKDAPLWNKKNIKKATKNWFKYLS
ncbi:GDP-mannose 4,6-dehydratase [Candidatus Pelagibacter sp.]|nr:GDP-mannose 4,6-dehydratase [Candidatus Pelagibacter sp.]